jgi:hypothetical protein
MNHNANVNCGSATKTRFYNAAKLICLLAATAVLSSCNDKELPDLKGRYQGKQAAATEVAQVVAELPAFASVNKTKILRFRVYQTLGSATGAEYTLTVLNEKSIRLTTPPVAGIPAMDQLLTKAGSCATAIGPRRESFTLCWSKGKLDLEVKSDGASQPLLALHIQRDNTLPPLDNRVGAGQPYTLDELVGRARFLNYAVSQEAERVYQARENIKVARGNLLPKLNVKAIVGIFTGDYVSAVGTFLPFLFPSNWYRFAASKALFEAERKSFASLRGNEMSAVEHIFYLVQRDQAVPKLVDQHVTWMRQTQQALAKEEEVGLLPTGTADYFGTTVRALEQDRTRMAALIRTQYGDLAHSVALPPMNGIAGLGTVEFPPLDSEAPIRGEDFFREAQSRSFEVRAINALVKAAKYLEGEVIFSFLDPEGSGGIGFGTPAALRVSKSRQAELMKKGDELYSLIEQKSAQIAIEYNTSIESYQITSSGLRSVQRRLDWLMKRHLTGDGTLDDNEFVDSLIDLQFKILELKAEQLSSSQTWLAARSKLDRVLLRGFYRDLEGAVPEDPEKIGKVENRRAGQSPAIL